MTAPRILVIDDHPVFAQGLQYVVQTMSEQPECVYAGDAEAALSLLEKDVEFDLILVDLNMPGISGESFLTSIASRKLDIPAVVISAVEDVSQISRALGQGAFGFIPKTLPQQEMQAAIARVLEGETFVPDSLKTALARLARKTRRTDSESGLTQRQIQVLRLVDQGQSNKQIAATLFVSEDTVKFHMRAVMDVLSARNRTECVAKAKELGIL